MNPTRVVDAYLRSASDSIPTEFYHGSPHSFTRFDMSKVGSGDGLNKHGYGFYFTDNEELATYYAREALPKAQRKGMFLYTVTLRGVRDFLPWDQLIPEDTYRDIADALEEQGHEKHANEMREELEGYHETYDLSQSYGILTHVLGGANKASEFLYDVGVPGATAKDIHGRGNIYVAFSDEIIRMVSKTTVKE